MRTDDIRRKLDLAHQRGFFTGFDVEGLRQRFGGKFTTQRGRRYRKNGVHGIWLHEHTEDPETDDNIVTNEGLNSVLDVYLNGATQITTWYLTMFTDNVTPAAGDTAAVPGTTEITVTDVAEAVRETYNANAASGQSIDNVAGPIAQYTADQAFTAYGAQLFGGGTSAFGNTAGVLWASSLFGSAKSLSTLDTIDVTYTFTAADS